MSWAVVVGFPGSHASLRRRTVRAFVRLLGSERCSSSSNHSLHRTQLLVNRFTLFKKAGQGLEGEGGRRQEKLDMGAQRIPCYSPGCDRKKEIYNMTQSVKAYQARKMRFQEIRPMLFPSIQERRNDSNSHTDLH